MLYGAILGDMIGAPYEFDRGDKTKDFELFTKGSHFTDDTVMTIAIADALLNVSKDASEQEIKDAVKESMLYWGRKYPAAGYGGAFNEWLFSKDPQPYNSWGNGAAMRVSPVAWWADNVSRVIEVARWTAEVTHNHPEGVRGAVATAVAIFLARTTFIPITDENEDEAKAYIKNYIEKRFFYGFDRTCDEIRPDYHHVESCQETVPEALTAFLEGYDFEDVIRTAVSLGGDCDTLTAIAGSVAEAFYGVPKDLKKRCRAGLPKEMLLVLDSFEYYAKH